ncbi:hypothetical protein KEM54_003409, partial [Ascosphaera aggregata]
MDFDNYAVHYQHQQQQQQQQPSPPFTSTITTESTLFPPRRVTFVLAVDRNDNISHSNEEEEGQQQQHCARKPLCVQISPHDSTESITSTVKNYYGIHDAPVLVGSRETNHQHNNNNNSCCYDGVSLEDEHGETLIARYENFRHTMTVYVRAIPASRNRGRSRRFDDHQGNVNDDDDDDFDNDDNNQKKVEESSGDTTTAATTTSTSSTSTTSTISTRPPLGDPIFKELPTQPGFRSRSKSRSRSRSTSRLNSPFSAAGLPNTSNPTIARSIAAKRKRGTSTKTSRNTTTKNRNGNSHQHHHHHHHHHLHRKPDGYDSESATSFPIKQPDSDYGIDEAEPDGKEDSSDNNSSDDSSSPTSRQRQRRRQQQNHQQQQQRRKPRAEQMPSSDISKDNILQDSRRKKPKFESS